MPPVSTDWTLADLLDDDSFFRALLTVWARYTDEGLKPGSEKWIFDDLKHGRKLLRDVHAEWCRGVQGRYRNEVGDDFSLFPYSISFVRRAFLSVRKLTKEQKVKFLVRYGVKVPDRIDDVPAE